MAKYSCGDCGMEVHPITCGKCGTELTHVNIEKDDGTTVGVAEWMWQNQVTNVLRT